MHTVTIVSADMEVGYGEGESLEYAKEDAFESLDAMGREYVKTFGYKLIIKN